MPYVPPGGGSSSGSKKKSKPISPRRQLIMVASRVARAKGPAREELMNTLGVAMAGIPRDQFYKIGEKAGIAPGDVDKLRMAADTNGGRTSGRGFAYAMDLLDRPVQAVKGAIVEPDSMTDAGGYLSGAWRGFSGKEKYGGSEAVLSLGNAAMGEADDKKIREQVESLPSGVRVPLDFVADTVLDPSNYVTLGGGAIAENAAKSIAKNLAQGAAERGLTIGAQDIFERVLTKGAKGLTVAEKSDLAQTLGKKTAKKLLRRANKAQGGVYFAGKKLPGSQSLQQAIRRRGVQDGGILAPVEQAFRTEAATRQAERAGLVAPGTTGTVESFKEGIRASDTAGDLAKKAAEKRAAEAVGRVERGIPDSVDITTLSNRAQKKILKAGDEALAKGRVDLDAVREALDVNGGPAAIAALPDKERALATELRAILDEQAAAKIDAGRIMDDATAPGVLGESAAAEDLAKAAEVEPRIRQLEERRLAAERRAAAYQQRLDQLNAENEFVDVPAIAGRPPATSRIYYRGTGRDTRALTGNQAWDDLFFTSHDPEIAKLYGPQVDEIRFRPDARIVEAGSSEFVALQDAARSALGPGRHGLLDEAAKMVELAREQGIDVLDFKKDYIGAPVLNPDAILRTPDVGQIPLFPKSDITRAKRIGETKRLLEREKTRLAQIVKLKDQAERKMSRSLLRSEDKRVAAEAGVVPQDRYFPQYRVDPDKAKGIFRGRRGAAGGVSGRRPDYTFGREWRGAASERPTDEFGRATVELNPVVAVGRAARDTAVDMGRIQRFEELSNMAAKDGYPIVRMGNVEEIKRTTPGWDELYVEKKQPVSRADDTGRIVTREEPILLHKSIAEDFDKVIQAGSDHAILKTIQYLNSMWARWATGTTGFISRNVLQGNLYMGMVLAEARDVRVWADTMGMFKRINRGIARYGDPLRFMDDAEKQLVQDAIDHGVISSGFYDDLAARTAKVTEGRGKILGGKWSPLSPNFRPVERISAANQWAENWSRLSVYRNKLKQGFTPEQAALVTDHYMLNYRNLSDVNAAGRYVNPFLTWVYKSTPMLLGEAARSPRKVLVPLAAANAINAEGMRDQGDPLLPSWMTQGGGVMLPDELGPAGGQVFMPDTPIHSALDAIQPGLLAGQIAANQIPGVNQVVPDPGPNAWGDLMRESWNTAGVGGVPGGLAKSIIEGMTNQQLFSGREYQPGEQVPVPVYSQVTGDAVPFQVKLLMENLFPLAGRAATFAPTSEYEKSAQARRLLSMVGGFGVYPGGKDAQNTAYRERIKLLEAAIKKVRSEGTADVPRRTRKGGSGSGGYVPPGG